MTDRPTAPSPAPPSQLELGLQQLYAGRNTEAANTLRGLVETSPAPVEALVGLGSAEMALNQWAAAETHFRQALNLAPHHPPAFLNLGVLLGASERHAEALALADATLAADPAHTQALLARGNALTGLSRLEEALGS